MHLRLATVACWLLALAAPLRADVVLAPLFQDRAVLQRDRPLAVWGRADPGEKIQVTLAGQSVGTTAARDGRWIVYLEPLPASAVPTELVVVGKNTVTVRDVLVGEVWLVAGDDLIALPAAPVPAAATSPAAGPAAPVRVFRANATPADEPVESVAGAWSLASTEGSAMVGAFARDLARRLQVPIGMLEAAAPGSGIDAWLSPAALASVGGSNAADAARLFNGTLHPLLPYALRGVIWAQGAADADRAAGYAARFDALITHWRLHLGLGDVPFFWLQTPPAKAPVEPLARAYARLREAQDHTLALPATGQAITIDLEPTDTREMGRRLALLARDRVYELPVDASGPLFERADRDGAGLRVFFRHADNGLTAGSRPPEAFEIAGSDRVFHPAAAVIQRNTILVSSPAVKEPVALRYAWTNAPKANLFNGAGLPAAPFRTDDW
jgi:sialate O-acetylesterase